MNGASFAPGVVGSAFSFDGVDDYVTATTFGMVESYYNLIIHDPQPVLAFVSNWRSVVFLVPDAVRLNLVSPSGLPAGLPRGRTGAGWTQNQYLPCPLAPGGAELGN
jgi:hypothetical protein